MVTCSVTYGDMPVPQIWSPPERQRTSSSVWNGDELGTAHNQGNLYSNQEWSAGVNDTEQWHQLNAYQVTCQWTI